MKAAYIEEFGAPEVFQYGDVPDPEPGRGELVIKVSACGINRYDLYLRMGAVFTDLTFPHVMGADVAGVIAAIGPDVEGWAVGDRCVAAAGYPLKADEWQIEPINAAPSFEVMGTHTWGGNAEYLRIPARFVLPDDTGLPVADVAAMPLVLMTSLHAVETLGEVGPGQRVLVQAGASGSGHACIQVARAMGAQVACTIGSDEKRGLVEEAGAELIINHRTQDFEACIREWTDGQGVDVVIDNVGASVFEGNLNSLRNGGIFVNFGLVGGMKGTINFRDLFFKRHQLRGSFMGTIDGLRKGLEMMKHGTVRAAVDRQFPLAESAEAHRYIDSRAVKGKVVLIP
ncbi:MAG: quinone oxidoreductase family protein [Phycisphaerae bacterium]